MIALPLLVAALTFVVAAWLLSRRRVRDLRRRVTAQLEPRLPVAQPEPERRRSRLRGALAASEPALARLPGWPRFVRLVDRADLRIGPVELVYAVAAATAGGFLLLAALGVPAFAAVLLVPAALFAATMLLLVRVDRRRRAFEEQLPELLSGLASALRAGHGLNQALQAAAEDAPEPAASELGRVLAETRLGRPLETSLAALGRRVGSRDLDFVLDAVVIQRQVGGSLAGIFEIVAASVRQRQQFVLRIRALTAMGRTSALVLLCLPVGLGLLLTLLNHAYLAPLFTSPLGRAMVAASVTLLALGTLWLRKIVVFRG